MLQPLATLTTQLQDEQLIIPQFHANWLISINQVKKVVEKQGNWNGGKVLLELIEARRKIIYQNPIILAGVYLDARFRPMLTPDEKAKAKDAIRVVFNKLNSLLDSHADDAVIVDEDDEESELESLIRGCSDNEAPGSSPNAASTASKLDLEMGIYEALPQVAAKTNPITFWKVNKIKFPLMFSVALDIICIPVTEVTAERLFSHLNFNKNRANLDPSVTDDILFQGWNKSFK